MRSTVARMIIEVNRKCILDFKRRPETRKLLRALFSENALDLLLLT